MFPLQTQLQKKQMYVKKSSKKQPKKSPYSTKEIPLTSEIEQYIKMFNEPLPKSPQPYQYFQQIYQRKCVKCLICKSYFTLYKRNYKRCDKCYSFSHQKCYNSNPGGCCIQLEKQQTKKEAKKSRIQRKKQKKKQGSKEILKQGEGMRIQTEDISVKQLQQFKTKYPYYVVIDEDHQFVKLPVADQLFSHYQFLRSLTRSLKKAPYYFKLPVFFGQVLELWSIYPIIDTQQTVLKKLRLDIFYHNFLNNNSLQSFLFPIVTGLLQTINQSNDSEKQSILYAVRCVSQQRKLKNLMDIPDFFRFLLGLMIEDKHLFRPGSKKDEAQFTTIEKSQKDKDRAEVILYLRGDHSIECGQIKGRIVKFLLSDIHRLPHFIKKTEQNQHDKMPCKKGRKKKINEKTKIMEQIQAQINQLLKREQLINRKIDIQEFRMNYLQKYAPDQPKSQRQAQINNQQHLIQNMLAQMGQVRASISQLKIKLNQIIKQPISDFIKKDSLHSSQIDQTSSQPQYDQSKHQVVYIGKNRNELYFWHIPSFSEFLFVNSPTTKEWGFYHASQYQQLIQSLNPKGQYQSILLESIKSVWGSIKQHNCLEVNPFQCQQKQMQENIKLSGINDLKTRKENGLITQLMKILRNHDFIWCQSNFFAIEAFFDCIEQSLNPLFTKNHLQTFVYITQRQQTLQNVELRLEACLKNIETFMDNKKNRSKGKRSSFWKFWTHESKSKILLNRFKNKNACPKQKFFLYVILCLQVQEFIQVQDTKRHLASNGAQSPKRKKQIYSEQNEMLSESSNESQEFELSQSQS